MIEWCWRSKRGQWISWSVLLVALLLISGGYFLRPLWRQHIDYQHRGNESQQSNALRYQYFQWLKKRQALLNSSPSIAQYQQVTTWLLNALENSQLQVTQWQPSLPHVSHHLHTLSVDVSLVGRYTQLSHWLAMVAQHVQCRVVSIQVSHEQQSNQVAVQLQLSFLLRPNHTGRQWSPPALSIAIPVNNPMSQKRNKMIVTPALHGISIIHLHYANATKMADTLKHARLIGQKSSIVVDQRNNALIVRGSDEHLQQIRQVIHELDKPVPQVNIAAKIAVVDQAGLKALGVLWHAQENTYGGFGTVSQASVNLPVANPAGVLGLGLGRLMGSMVSLELQAIQSQGNGKVIATPELTVNDNHEALISQGDEVPFQTSTSSGATQVEFKPATLSLQVTPHITPDQHIVLALKITKDSLTHQTGTAGATPIIATAEIRTHVLVKNGQTIVLGGIKINEHHQEEKRVPYLASIPGLGALFRQKSTTDKQMNLMVFVTPKIISS